MNADVMKWIGALLAGAAWFALVWIGKADADQFVQFLMLAILGVGAHGLAKGSTPKAPKAEPSAAPPRGLPPQKGSITLLLAILLVMIAIGVSWVFAP